MNRLPVFITRNFKLKLGCAVLALITWTGVVYAGNPPTTKVIHVPVPQGGVPKGFILVHKIQDLPLRVGGTRDAVNNFDPSSDVTVKLDWKSVTAGGVQNIPVSVDNNDPSVELLDVPTSVQGNIDTLTSVSVPVSINFTANPPPGISLGAQAVSPPSVTVIGPSHELKDMKVRANVDLTDKSANYQASLAVFPFDANGNSLSGDVQLNPSTVTVTVQLSSVVTSRVVAVQPSFVGRVASGYAVTAIRYSPQSITISGPQTLLNNIDALSTSNISINGLTGNVNLTVQLLLPDGVTASVSTVTVNLVVTPIATPTATPAPSPSPTP